MWQVTGTNNAAPRILLRLFPLATSEHECIAPALLHLPLWRPIAHVLYQHLFASTSHQPGLLAQPPVHALALYSRLVDV
jgi:hypothetical protein